MNVNLALILGLAANAQSLVKIITDLVDQFRAAGKVLTEKEEAELSLALRSLQKTNDQLFDDVQKKLRGNNPQ